MEGIRIFFVLYFIVFVIYYALITKYGQPPVLPGDYYKIYGPRRIFIPFGTVAYITILLFIFLRYFSRAF